MLFYALLRSIGVVVRDCVGDCVRDCVRDDVRDYVRDESLETPLYKGFLLKNVRDERFCSILSIHAIYGLINSKKQANITLIVVFSLSLHPNK